MKHDKKLGLSAEQVEQSRTDNGTNLLTPPKETPWYILYLEKFKDPIITILLIATAISLGFGIVHHDFTESVGIIIAILLATGVGFWQEYDAKKKFDAMRTDKDYELVKVRRDGVVQEISKDQLVVGDIVILSAGDEIPADIKLDEVTEMKVSEASMTGESKAVSKHPISGPYRGSGFAPNVLLRGTTIEQGLGEGTVTHVGDATEIGKTTRQAAEETSLKTPLEEQLHGLAQKINIAALTVGSTMFIILNIMHWKGLGWSFDTFFTQETLLIELQYLMAAVVVIILAVPEGLPLAVVLSLAFSMKTMAKQHNLVKKMHACETVGAVNVVFTDKTGTLTQNSMSVVDVNVIHGRGKLLDTIGAVNSTANWSTGDRVLGNPTEAAILKSIGREESEQLRMQYAVIGGIPFSSLNKYMVTHVVERASDSQLILIKGAPEIVAQLIGDESFLTEVSTQQARGRRAISAAMFNSNDFARVKANLETYTPQCATYAGTWFIEDPVRDDVPEAIAQCYAAGIDVVMMTGDNIKTGTEIADQAGFQEIWYIEASQFEEVLKNPPNARKFPNVIARCTPTDKLNILRWAQDKGLTCAMTGDGVNDSPSLNYADVGIAMGSGTSVAKEASDIVLLNDAFPSIVTGIKWGRTLYKNIKNFLYLQLSINVSACLIAVAGPLVGVEMPFTVTQFLWINLVMDSLAAIALASEPADDKVLEEKPRDRRAFIIDKRLAFSIIGFGGFIWLLSTLALWGYAEGVGYLSLITPTVFFAGYMMLNWWNLFNARVIGKGCSSLAGLRWNSKFMYTSLGILITTVLIVEFGGELFRTEPLSWETWLIIFAVTSPVAWVRELWYQLFSKK